MSTTLPPHLSFFSFPPEIREKIYKYIPNVQVHRPIQLLRADGTPAAVKVVRQFPCSTIRQTCKFIAHEAKPIVWENSKNFVRTSHFNYGNSFSRIMLEPSALPLLAHYDSFLSIALRWFGRLRQFDRDREASEEKRRAEWSHKYRHWPKFEEFKRDEGILDMDLDTLEQIEGAGRKLRDGIITIQIWIKYGDNDEPPPSVDDVVYCATRLATHTALYAMGKKYGKYISILYDPQPGQKANEWNARTWRWLNGYNPTLHISTFADLAIHKTYWGTRAVELDGLALRSRTCGSKVRCRCHIYRLHSSS